MSVGLVPLKRSVYMHVPMEYINNENPTLQANLNKGKRSSKGKKERFGKLGNTFHKTRCFVSKLSKTNLLPICT